MPTSSVSAFFHSQSVGLIPQVYKCRLRQFLDVCCTVYCVQGCLFTASPSLQTINGCVCNGLVRPSYLYRCHQVIFSDNSLSSLWDHDARFRVRRYVGQRCLLECVIEQHSGWKPRVMVFRIMGDSICYELRTISLVTETSGKCYSWKSFTSFKASLELSFSRIMHGELQRLF